MTFHYYKFALSELHWGLLCSYNVCSYCPAYSAFDKTWLEVIRSDVPINQSYIVSKNLFGIPENKSRNLNFRMFIFLCFVSLQTKHVILMKKCHNNSCDGIRDWKDIIYVAGTICVVRIPPISLLSVKKIEWTDMCLLIIADLKE